jgi:hypothetical protein
MRRAAFLTVGGFSLAAVAAACGAQHDPAPSAGPAADGGVDSLDDAPAFDGYVAPSAPVGLCGAVSQEHPIEGYNHVAVCSYVDYQTLPPSSGNHYPYWAAYMTYDQPLPEGYWVHNLEHGTIVLSYNCGEAGCADDIAAAQQMMDQFPDDPICPIASEGVHHRLLMTPDPRLDVRFAASAWGWTLRANCFDPVAFLAFANAHYGQGREAICDQGEDVIGTSSDPPGCGAPP